MPLLEVERRCRPLSHQLSRAPKDPGGHNGPGEVNTARKGKLARSAGGKRKERGAHSFRTILAAVIFTFVLFGFLWLLLAGDWPLRRMRLIPTEGNVVAQQRNAIWLAHTWVGESHSQAEIDELIDSLAGRGFRTLYLHAGPLDADGSLPADRYPYAKQFVSAAKTRHDDVRLLAWLGALSRHGDGELDLADPRVHRNIVTAARTLAAQGWDGIHLNIEPLPNGRHDYLSLLEAVRMGLGEGKIISVAGQRLWPLPVPLYFVPKVGDFVWDADYLREVAARVDQVAVMTYDSALPLPNLFIQYQRLETVSLVNALSGFRDVELLVGVPTYSDTRANFDERVENMATGLQGVIEAVQGFRDPSPFAGVAVYAHWTTSEEEWGTYDRLWLGR